MDSLVFEFKNNDCHREIKKYNKQPKYNFKSFPHHSSNTFHHSIWTARAMETMWNDRSKWFYQVLIEDQINDEYKNLSLFLAFYHDIGKMDGDFESTIKPHHPENGYNLLINNFDSISKEMFGCIKYKYPASHWKTYKMLGILSIISLCHQDFGNVMQKKISIIDYLRKIFFNVEKFPSFKFHILDYNLILRLTLLISFADVIGARPVSFPNNYKSEWNILNYNIDQNDFTISPWDKYKYNEYALEITKEVLILFQKVTNTKLNMNEQGLASENIERKVKNIKINNQTYEILVGVVSEGTLLYKAMGDFITQSMHQNYKKASWYASSHTAEIYTGREGIGGNYKYIFEVTKNIELIYLDNPRNIETLYQIILHNNKWNYNKKISLIHLLQFAFGINASPEFQKKLMKKLIKGEKIVILDEDTFGSNDNTMKRWSYHNLDIRIMEEIICYFGLDGYMARKIRKFDSGTFHEEIAICRSYENVKIKKLEKIVDGRKILLNSIDMIYHILDIPNIMDNIFEFQLGGNKKDKKEMIRKNIKKIFGFKIGGKNRKNKKIRKHKGINQNTGNLNKGYRYSKKILKNGQKQIEKK